MPLDERYLYTKPRTETDLKKRVSDFVKEGKPTGEIEELERWGGKAAQQRQKSRVATLKRREDTGEDNPMGVLQLDSLREPNREGGGQGKRGEKLGGSPCKDSAERTN